MSTYETIRADFLAARKAKDMQKIAFLSTLIGDIDNAAPMVDGKKVIFDELVIPVLKSFAKKANENLAYTPDAAKQELEWINSYLPAQLSEDEIRKIFTDLDHSNMGLMMKHLKENYAGRYDGATASKVAKEFV